MTDDVLINKAEIIERCLHRINEEYAGTSEHLRLHQTKQDSILLNLKRACQAAIDLAMRVVRIRRLGLPKESREAFDLIMAAGIIDQDLCRRMHGLVGFRNTAIHNYRKLDLDIVEAVITQHLNDFLDLSQKILKAHGNS